MHSSRHSARLGAFTTSSPSSVSLLPGLRPGASPGTSSPGRDHPSGVWTPLSGLRARRPVGIVGRTPSTPGTTGHRLGPASARRHLLPGLAGRPSSLRPGVLHRHLFWAWAWTSPGARPGVGPGPIGPDLDTGPLAWPCTRRPSGPRPTRARPARAIGGTGIGAG